MKKDDGIYTNEYVISTIIKIKVSKDTEMKRVYYSFYLEKKNK